MTSVFDAQTFLDTEVQGAIDTTIIPIPENEYPAQVDRAVKFRKIDTKDGQRVVCDVTWAIDDEKVKKITGLERPTCRQTLFLDLTEEGALDLAKGKNRQLGLLREALGQNDPKRKWSFGMLEGQMGRVVVTHSPNSNDPDGPPYSNVTKVTKV